MPHGLLHGDIGDPAPMQSQLEARFGVTRDQVRRLLAPSRSLLSHAPPHPLVAPRNWFGGAGGVGSRVAALKAGGSVVTWGNRHRGGDSTNVQQQLVDVQHIYATNHAFAALKAGQSRLCSSEGWGQRGFMGQCRP